MIGCENGAYPALPRNHFVVRTVAEAGVALGHLRIEQQDVLDRGCPEYEALLERLGAHNRSKACLYLTRLASVDVVALEEIVRQTYLAAQDGAAGC
jgi:hypothetical protein